jgi:hypothetical protein
MQSPTVLEMLHSGHEDMVWFNKNESTLIKDFNNYFVAIHNKTVIDSDKNLNTLMKKLKDKKVDVSVVFIEFISDIKSIL